MRTRLALLLFLFPLVLFSQSDSARLGERLKYAERLARSKADSCRLLLREVERDPAFAQLPPIQGAYHRLLSIWHREQGDYPTAMKHIRVALQIFVDLGYQKEQAACENAMANIFIEEGDYPAALEHYLASLKLQEAIGNLSGVAKVHNNIGVVYRNLGDDPKAQEHFSKAYELAKAKGDKSTQSSALDNQGNVYGFQGKYAQALQSYETALKLRREVNDLKGVSKLLCNIGNTYGMMRKGDLGLSYLDSSLLIREELNDPYGIAICLINMSAIHLERARYDTALLLLQRGLKISEEIGSLDNVKECCNNLSKVYEQIGQPAEALKYYKQFIAARDSLFSEERSKEIVRREMQFSFDKEKAAQDEKLQRGKLMNLSLSVGIVLVLLLALVVGYGLLRNRRQKRLLEQKNVELERLSIVASETENVVLIMDAEGRVEWVNESFVRLNAISLDELKQLKGETIFEISNNPGIRKIVEDCIRTRKPYTYESFNLTRDGKRVWESSTLTPIIDAEGQVRKLVIIDSDVTEAKLAEETIRLKNKDITDSINYAKKIQDANLPKLADITRHLPESFVLFRPRDIVSGDFYWFSKKEEHLLLAAADCTGHGVPGALMSMIGGSLLHQIANEKTISDPAQVLLELDRQITRALQQTGAEGESRDGMDIAFVEIAQRTRTLRYAGANRPLYLVRGGELQELKPDKFPIGGAGEKQFAVSTLELQRGDIIYVFSDGYADQFGGPGNKKITSRRFRELLLELSPLPMEEQKTRLERYLADWTGAYQQTDDILVMGVRFS